MTTAQTKHQPIKKKVYKLPVQPKRLDEFEIFFNNYLKPKWGLTSYFKIPNKHSRVDYFVTSGNSTGIETALVIEWKTRDDVSVTKYPNAMAEKEKFDKCLEIAKNIGCPAYYFVQMKEAICCWLIDPNKEYQTEIKHCPVTFNSNRSVDKEILLLEFKDAALIYARRMMTRATPNELQAYIYKEKIKFWLSMKGYLPPEDIDLEINHLNKKIAEL